MYKLSIFDRDQQEIVGINWLISKYAFPISKIKTGSQISTIVEKLEKEPPDILCIELDMIPEDKWEMVKPYIQDYARQVIAITAEATFERAMQAMSIQAIDLWVKPLSPSRMKLALQRAVRNLSTHKQYVPFTEHQKKIPYESLFIDDHIPFTYPVYLLETEYKTDLDLLRTFIKQFDFYYEPIVFSKSDGVVLVFRHIFPDPYLQAQRLLGEWDQMTGKALAIVVHEQSEGASLHQIYRQLSKEMEKTFFTGYKQVLHTKNVSEWIDVDPFLTMEEQRQWVSMLAERNGEHVKKWLYADFFDIEPPYPEPGLLRTRLTSILAQVRRFMIQKGIVDRDEAYNKIFHSILYEPVLYRIVQDFILFLNDLFQAVEKQQTKYDIVEMAMAYMEKHYSNASLSLADVATHVQRSPSYFSYLLSKRREQSFKQLLLQIRIEKAKELLESTNEPIQNIASQVGFSHPNYFSKVFKIETGLSPRDFKQRTVLKT